MRALMVLVVGMGVLIVAGVAVVAVTILHRMGGAAPLSAAASVMDEPAGTHIAGVAGLGPERLAVLLQGGGPDRVVLLDPASGRRLGLLRLAH